MEARAAAHSAQPGCGLRTKQVLRRKKVWRASYGHTLWAPFPTSHWSDLKLPGETSKGFLSLVYK